MQSGTRGTSTAIVGSGLIADDFVTMAVAASSCVVVHDAVTGRVQWANPAACAVLELSQDDLATELPSESSSGSGHVIDRAGIDQALARGTCRLRFRFRTRTGREIPADVVATQVDLSTGPAVVVQFRDVALDRQTEHALRLTASYVEALSRHTAAGLLVLAPDGDILHATDRALVQFGLARTAVVGARISDLCQISTTIDDEGALHGWGPALEAANPIGSVRLRLPLDEQQSVWLGGTLERLTTSGSDELLLTVHDISDRVKDQQRRAMELLRENYLARYNVMGDMAMAIAHELGQPLAAAGNFLAGVRARTAALATGGSLPFAAADQIDYGLESARRQIDRVSTIVATLRAFVGHLEHVEQTVDLNDVISECLYFVRLQAAPHGVSVDVSLSPEPVLVRCERVLTGQVVLNLCSNAIDELSQCEPERRRIVISTSLRERTGEVTVDDCGRGIPRDPFAESFTSKEHGSGIGLALSHRIITRQHGKIWAERRDAGGSRFGFRLPLASARPLGPATGGE